MRYLPVVCYLLTLLLRPSFVNADNAATASPAKIKFASSDWPWWRGPHRDGIASPDQDPPLEWSESKNVAWKAPVPGRSHGSITVVGDQVVLAAADEEADTQSVICFDRATGKQLWETLVHSSGIERGGNKKASQASTTVACDGERFFVNFLNNKAAYTRAIARF